MNLTILPDLSYSFPAATQLAVGFDRPNRDASASIFSALFLCLKFFMVGVMGILRDCCIRDAVCQPVTSAAQGMTASVGGNLPFLTEAYHA